MKRSLMYMVKNVFIFAIVALSVFVSIFPIYWTLLTSVVSWQVVLTYPPKFLPTETTIEYWDAALKKLFLPLRNSLIIASATTFIALLVGTLAGYSFARFKIGGPHISFWMLSVRFLPGIVPLVALYILFRSFHLLDTPIAVIGAHLIITVPFAVWMMKGFIEKIPTEIEEAALLDGCSSLGVIRRIVIPLASPGMVVTALFSFIWSWNEFMFALILTKSSAYTLPVMIASWRGAGVIWGGVSASALIAIIPSLFLAIFLQKYLVSGLTFGMLRG